MVEQAGGGEDPRLGSGVLLRENVDVNGEARVPVSSRLFDPTAPVGSSDGRAGEGGEVGDEEVARWREGQRGVSRRPKKTGESSQLPPAL